MSELQALAEAKTEALSLYIDGVLSPAEICANLNIKPALLNSWIKKEDWNSKRDEADEQIITRSNVQFKKHIAKRRLETAERHLRIATMIEDQIRKRIEQAEDPAGTSQLSGIPINMRELREMSQALKNSADTSARAVVLTERETDFNGKFGNDDGVKRLINVNIMPIGPAPSQQPMVNITSECIVKKPSQIGHEQDPF